MTYGQIRFRIQKAFPSLDLDLIDGWIQDRYADILEELSWSRLAVDATLQTTAPYATGTVTVTNGSAAVVGDSTVWTAAMTGRSFRVAGRTEFYRFTRVTDTTGTLDRAYEGPTAADAGYSIFRNVYALPAACRLVEDDAFSSFSLGPLERLTKGQLNQSDPGRLMTGTPQVWASYMDDSSSPPQMQIELYPVPDASIGIPYRYIAEATTPTATGTSLLPWHSPSALIAGVSADCARHLKDPVQARDYEALYQRQVSTLKNNEARRGGATRMELDTHFTDYRVSRYSR